MGNTQLAVHGLWLLELQATADDTGRGPGGMRISGERGDMLGSTEWEYHVLGLGMRRANAGFGIDWSAPAELWCADGAGAC